MGSRSFVAAAFANGGNTRSRIGTSETARPHPAPTPAGWQRRQQAIPRISRRRRRKLPQAPANPRDAGGEKTRARRKSPPIPAYAESAMTGLSRRRSRVRVPSLPLKNILQFGIFCCQHGRSRPPAFRAFPSSSRTRRKVAVCRHFRSSADCTRGAIPRPLHSATAFRLNPAPKTVPVEPGPAQLSREREPFHSRRRPLILQVLVGSP